MSASLAVLPEAAAQCLPGLCTGNVGGVGQCGQNVDFCVPGAPDNPPACAGSGCNFVLNCRPLIVPAQPEIEVFPQPNGTFTARLTFEVTAPWNKEAGDDRSPDYNPNGTLDMFWFTGATVCTGAVSICEYFASDVTRCFVERTGLTCAGAPYNFGTYSFRAQVCQGPGPCGFPFPPPCGRWQDRNNLAFVVPEASLPGCIPPPDDCNDNKCRDCRPVGPCSAPVGGQGASCKFTQSGAHLSYRAGGAGGTGFPGTADWRTSLGLYVSHDYAQRIVLDNPTEGNDHVWLITGGGSFREFRDPAAGSGLRLYDPALTAPSDEYRRLYYDTATGGWQLDHLDGRRDVFRADGRWERMIYAADPGHPKVATYSGSQLTRVDFPDGRQETFEYYPSGKLQRITEVGVGVADCALQPGDCRAWTYTWSGDELALIDRPDGTAWELTYDPARNGNRPGYLTELRLTAGAESRIEAAFEYDAAGNVVRSWRGDPSFTGPDAVDKQELAYVDAALPTETAVTEWLDDTTTFTTTYDLGRDSRSIKARVESIAGVCASCGLSPDTSFEYSDGAHPLLESAMIDGRGNRTTYSYTATGRVAAMTEAVGTGLQRLTSFSYDANFPGLVTQVEVPSTSGTAGQFRRTITSYAAATGLATSSNLTGFEAGSALPDLTTSYTYNPSGEVDTVDPPGYGSADVTAFTYDVPGRNGHLPDSRIDPIVGATSFSYDALNRRTRVIDPNGVAGDSQYDALGRITRLIQRASDPPPVDPGAPPGAGDLVTGYAYNGFGDLDTVTLPNGNLIVYGYESGGARRLTTIERRPDAATPAERTFYTLDRVGNRIVEELQRWDGAQWVTESKTGYVYSSRCHVDKIVRGKDTAYESTTEYCYDANDNLERSWDANHPRAGFPNAFTLYAYDALDRLTSVSQPWGGAGGGSAVTTYGYDVQDHLDLVTDAEGNATLYETSDRDLTTLEASPAFSGPTPFKTFTYNLHGELESEADPRGIAVARTLDALDRLTLVDYADDALDTAYTYDDPSVPFAIGRLTEISRTGSTVGYEYDRFGRMTADGTLGFAYDDNGNRTEVRYPGGLTACYDHDFADREVSLSFTTAGGSDPCLGSTTPLVAAAAYLPFGPLRSVSLANGVVETRLFDQRFHPAAITAAGATVLLDWSYTTDAVGNVTLIDELTPPSQDRSYGYQDQQYFLTSGTGPWGAQSWTYDRIGNRLTESDSTAPAMFTYTYQPNGASQHTPLLDRITPAPGNSATGMLDYGYDAAGNQTSITASGGELFGTDTLGYNQESRLAALATDYGSAQSAITYDGRGFLHRSLLTYTNSADFLIAEPTYGSEGLLYSRRSILERTLKDPETGQGPEHTDKTTDILYFAGRPIAQRTTSNVTKPSLLFLTTDHLGTPILATDDQGDAEWQGGFEPFGGTFTFLGGTEILLRFPGQWVDSSWEVSGRVAELSHNVYRWYETGTGRYTRTDPLLDPFRRSVLGPVYYGMIPANELGQIVADFESNHYAYVDQDPLGSTDPFGLQRNCQREGCDMFPNWLENRRRRACCECHDTCFRINFCRATSWGHTILTCLVPFIEPTECDRCNRFATRCFFRSFFGRDTACPWPIPPPEELYCRNPEPPVVPPGPRGAPAPVF